MFHGIGLVGVSKRILLNLNDLINYVTDVLEGVVEGLQVTDVESRVGIFAELDNRPLAVLPEVLR